MPKEEESPFVPCEGCQPLKGWQPFAQVISFSCHAELAELATGERGISETDALKMIVAFEIPPFCNGTGMTDTMKAVRFFARVANL